MFGFKPKQNPHSYIVVLETGAYWADEFGVKGQRIAPGTFHRVVGSDNSHFAEAVMIASMMHGHLSQLQGQIAELAQDVKDMALPSAAPKAPVRPLFEKRLVREASVPGRPAAAGGRDRD